MAVWDEDALRFADFAAAFGSAMGLPGASRTRELAAGIQGALQRKRAGDVDCPEVLAVKRLIRACEARSGEARRVQRSRHARSEPRLWVVARCSCCSPA